jgi:uncharacterized protein (TIRG00374 family)
MRIGSRDYDVRMGLTIFLVISIVSVLTIFILTTDTGTWMSLRHIRPVYGVLACLLMLTQWCLNAVRFRILVNSLGSNVSFMTSLRAFMANVFISAVTPSQTGGGAMQIYILNRAGVPIAKGFAGCLMGAVLTVVGLLTSTLVVISLRPGLRAELGARMIGVLASVVIVFSILALLFVLSIVKTAFMKQIVGRILLVVTRFLGTQRRLAFTKRVMGGVDQYRQSLAEFAGAKKRRVLLALAFTLAGIATNASIAPVLLAGLGVEYDLINVYLVQFVLLFIAYFGPTPGASGIVEFSNYWMLSSLSIQSNMLGIYTLLWRFFTSFIAVAVGGLTVLSLISRRKVQGD